MNGLTTIEAKVVSHNVVLYEGRALYCWENAVYEAVAPRPLDLHKYVDKMVCLSGHLHGGLWSASLIRVIEEDSFVEITGEVTGSNVVNGQNGAVRCYKHAMNESVYSPLSLVEYMGRVITVSGILRGSDLYRAEITKVPSPEIDRNPSKEAKSLKDLLLIRQANRSVIEAVNGNLGTALGYKWSNNQNTGHPAIIVFVPQKMNPDLIPEEQRVKPVMEAPDGTWCLTDVVTGGKKGSLDEMDPLPELSYENQVIVDELCSGRVGLVGGIQLAFFGDGIRDAAHSYVGTAAIAVNQKGADGKRGFLTNQHVGDAPGRTIFHPWHLQYPIGFTRVLQEYEADEDWYYGIIDESESYVRCDCAFVQLDDALRPYLSPGLHRIGQVGDVYKIDVNNLDIIGKPVISIGRTRGIQRGTIAAYAYEFQDDYYSLYTDLLIIGEEGKAFSWKGDSGKLIVTDDDAHQPVALLWGGWKEKLRQGKEQEIWSYAIDLGKVLDRLGLEIYQG